MTNFSSNEPVAFEGPNFAANDDDEEFDEDLDEDYDDDGPLAEPEGEGDHNALDDDAGNRMDGGSARAVLEHVARSIVDDPDAVVVEVAPGRSGLKLSLHVAPGDMGRIIGKRGRVAQAVRAIVRAAAAREGTDAAVDIVD
jgi:predicted RNA-binding protein YlqC (UPF0109 family)